MGHRHVLFALLSKLYLVLFLTQLTLSAELLNLPASDLQPVTPGMRLSSRSASQVPLFGKCGGIGWTGPTTCVQGAVCQVFNPFFSQCRSAPPAPSTSSITKPSNTVLTGTPAAPTPPTISTDTRSPDTSESILSTTLSVDTPTATIVFPTASPSPTDSSDVGHGSRASDNAGSSGDAGPSSDSASGTRGPAGGNITTSFSDPSFTGPLDNPGPSNTTETNLSHQSDPTASVSPVSASANSKNNRARIIAGVLVPLLLIILGIAGFILYKRRQRARDRREWERTHQEIAGAVREVGGSPPYTGGAWASRGDTMGYTAPEKGGGDTGTDAFIEKPVAHQYAEYSAPFATQSPDFYPYEKEKSKLRPASSIDSASI
ncbi:hypothetical protein C8R44DRAFT_790718 [Mycena epipterygia]|nr:hypothetical protein C8R44DRAFT_790718 [Mycena epipterygia]